MISIVGSTLHLSHCLIRFFASTLYKIQCDVPNMCSCKSKGRGAFQVVAAKAFTCLLVSEMAMSWSNR